MHQTDHSTYQINDVIVEDDEAKINIKSETCNIKSFICHYRLAQRVRTL